MSGKQGRIAVIGSNMVDLVTYVTRMPVKGETVEAPSFEMGHGGKGANQAVAAAKTLGRDLIITTNDLAADSAVNVARGEFLAVGAQQPYDQGVAEAKVAALAWNLVESFLYLHVKEPQRRSRVR